MNGARCSYKIRFSNFSGVLFGESFGLLDKPARVPSLALLTVCLEIESIL